MINENAFKILLKVMGWDDELIVRDKGSKLVFLAQYKYDSYQRFAPGKRFIESLALWLNQFDQDDRENALDFVLSQLVFLSEDEFTHLVETAYPDVIVQERIRIVSEEKRIKLHLVGQITSHQRFKELGIKSLYLGLSDGARTSQLRRSSLGEINNEQIWQAYELEGSKAEDMIKNLGESLENAQLNTKDPRFAIVWLVDDFSGSGYSYIRYDNKSNKFKGKIAKIYERLNKGILVDPSHYEVFLLLYVATQQAIDHIEYWTERFTSEYGYKPLQIRVLCPLGQNYSLKSGTPSYLEQLVENEKYYDSRAFDKHLRIGKTNNAKWGFANCALPVVLSHNSPNNSIYMLWGDELNKFFGLFPRVSRHREF